LSFSFGGLHDGAGGGEDGLAHDEPGAGGGGGAAGSGCAAAQGCKCVGSWLKCILSQIPDNI